MSALACVLLLAAAPDVPAAAPINAIVVEGDVRVELVVGNERGVEVVGDGIEVGGPHNGRLRVTAPARAGGPRATVRVRVDARTLELVVQRGAQLRAHGERLEALTLEVRHTSRVDVAALACKTLALVASEAARVRARGETVTVRADRSAQVVLVGKPIKLTQDVRGAARLTFER